MKFLFVVLIICFSFGKEYYIDNINGDNKNSGDIYHPLKNLSKLKIKNGDSIFFKNGQIFKIHIVLNNKKNVLISNYGNPFFKKPIINSDGYLAGILLNNCSNIKIANIHIVSNGKKAFSKKAKKRRFGIYINNSNKVIIKKVLINNIFSTLPDFSEGDERTYSKLFYGKGIFILNSKNINIFNSIIEKTGYYGIQIKKSNNIIIKKNFTKYTGGSGLQISKSYDVNVSYNKFINSGSKIDKRMKGRGSGSWCWNSSHILYEHNLIKNSHGEADSCGIHIDYWCNNVTVQYNLSIHNEGGFVEILGGGYNNIYRFNISVNDGYRIKNIKGARQDGKVIFISGYCGKKRKRTGPRNIYIYNNTVFTDKTIIPRIIIKQTAQDIYIFNNIFYFEKKPVVLIKGKNIFFQDNMLNLSLAHNIFYNLQFLKKGGNKVFDYIPMCNKIEKANKLGYNLCIKKDILNNEINCSKVSFGAINY